MRLIKILYITHTTTEGGSSTALVNILKGMGSKSVECAVVVPTQKGYLVDQLKCLGVNIYVPKYKYEGYHVYPRVKSVFKWLLFFLSDTIREYIGEYYISKVVDLFKPDIVHTNSTACVVGYNVCKKKGIKHVWHIREYMDIGFDWTPRPSASFHKRRLLNKFNYNIAITRAIFNYYNLRAQDSCIYDGVLDTNISYYPQTGFKAPFFLFVGALMESKGIGVAVQQFLSFHRTDSIYHLVIIGPSKDTELVANLKKEVQKQGASDYVHWLGLRSDVFSWMLSSTALLVPSYNEGFGFTSVEGMYCRTVVIGRDSAGLKEQFDIGLDDTGVEIALRFSSDDEIPSLLRRVTSEDFSVMKEYAYQVVTTRYTLKANSDRIYFFYCEILSISNNY